MKDMVFNNYDVVIIGCGITGSVIARKVAEKGKSVLILEKRNHIGGNMYDYTDNHGILVQKYGPHIFHTNDKEVYDFIKQYEDWNDYKLICGAVIDGTCTPTPFNFKTIDDFYSLEDANILKQHIKDHFKDRQFATVVEMINHEDTIIRNYAEFLFNKDYKLYTAKQWGVSPDIIDVSVLKRVPIRFSYEDGYFDDKYQVMPNHSYTRFFEKLLDHPNITIKLNYDALDYIFVKEGKVYTKDGSSILPLVVYTGAIDELLHYEFGYLPYRSLEFEWNYSLSQSIQDCPVVAFPQEKDFTRITEYKKLPYQDVLGTTYAKEYPLEYKPNSKLEPYYPVITEESCKKYNKYKDVIDNVNNLICCGRLADYKYYNMDQALKRALEVSQIIICRIGEISNYEK